MTKILTEQWRAGTLPNGKYYVKDWDGTINRFVAQNKILWRDLNNPIYAGEMIEVLAPVPSYDEVKEMSQKIERLEFDNEALEISRDELEKKLNKAEDAIREAYWKCENCYKGVCQYCLNSGVKCYMQRNKVESVGKLKEKLDIAVKALEEYANEKNWRDSVTELNTDFFEYENSMYKMEPNGFEEAQIALKQIKEVK